MPLMGKLSITFADYDSEKSTAQFNVPAITSANFTAQETLKNALIAAVNGIVLGEQQKYEWGNVSTSSLDPGPIGSQRELKWLVSYHDPTTLKRYSLELPTADVAQLDPNDRPHAEIGDTDVVDAFITAFEAAVLSPDGNAVVVDEITLVGRPI